MSKWINKELFSEFQDKKKKEKDRPAGGGLNRGEMVWKTPEKGTSENAKVYEGRFLPDPKGKFYMEYLYHMFQSGEKWMFILCPKTFDFDCFCPFCTATSKLYMGTQADKSQAYNYKRKQKFVGNWFVVDDPRDAEAEEDKKVNESVRLYEFPSKVEAKLKEEITDARNGLGASIFDPSGEGYNFILKVMSTKRDKNGRVWPDYSNSTFSRRSSALGNDARIDEIMGTVINLEEYIKGMEREDDDIITVLKNEMLWDLIEDDWKKYKHQKIVADAVQPLDLEGDIDDSGFDKPVEEAPPWEGENEGSEGLSDEDLLAELDSL